MVSNLFTNNDGSRCKHFRDGRRGSNTNAGFVVGRISTGEDTRLFSDLPSDFFDHFLGSLSDGFHGESRESVRKHCTNKETSEDQRIGNTDTSFCIDSVGVVGISSSSDEGTV